MKNKDYLIQAFHIPAEDVRKFKEICADIDSNMSHEIRMFIKSYIDKHKKKFNQNEK